MLTSRRAKQFVAAATDIAPRASIVLFLFGGVCLGQTGEPKTVKPAPPGNAVLVLRLTDKIKIRALDASSDLMAWSGELEKGSSTAIRVWDLEKKKQIARLPGHVGNVNHILLYENIRRLLSAGEDKTVRLFDIDAGKEVVQFANHPATITDIGMSYNGQHVVTGSTDNFVRIFDVNEKRERLRLEGHTSGDLRVAVNRDRVLSGSAAGSGKDFDLRLWELADGNEIKKLAGHTAAVVSIDLSPDGKRAISASKDGTVRIWNLETGREERRLEGHAAVDRVKFGTSALAVTTGGNSWRLWDVATGRAIARMPPQAKETVIVAAQYFAGGCIAAGGEGLVHVWDARAAIHRQEGIFPDIVSSLSRGEGQRPAVGLGIPSEPATVPGGTEMSALFRELFRQSLLIAARDELRLPTRDGLLGETLPTGAKGSNAAVDFTINWSPNGHRLELVERVGQEAPRSYGRITTQRIRSRSRRLWRELRRCRAKRCRPLFKRRGSRPPLWPGKSRTRRCRLRSRRSSRK